MKFTQIYIEILGGQGNDFHPLILIRDVIYPLVMTFTVRHGFSMALIEIDGLPNLIAW